MMKKYTKFEKGCMVVLALSVAALIYLGYLLVQSHAALDDSLAFARESRTAECVDLKARVQEKVIAARELVDSDQPDDEKGEIIIDLIDLLNEQNEVWLPKCSP